MTPTCEELPCGLRTWFVVHFVADLVFAIPLFVAPTEFLSLFGWTTCDPASSRLVAAALFGIGIESWLGRDSAPETFRAMLNLKVIWSGAATLGLVVSSRTGELPWGGWLFVLIFGAFHVLWAYYRLRLRAAASSSSPESTT